VLKRLSFHQFLIAVIGAAAVAGIVGATLYIRTRNKSTGPPATAASVASQKLSALFAGGSKIGSASNLDVVATAHGLRLTPGQAAYLEKNHFLLVPLRQSDHETFDDMLTYFDGIGGDYDPHQRAPQNPKLVTPDIVLHAYHKYFHLALIELKQTELSSLLQRFLTGLAGNATQAASQAPPEMAVRYQNILSQMNVARALLERGRITRNTFHAPITPRIPA
jgi:hypothetical protein